VVLDAFSFKPRRHVKDPSKLQKKKEEVPKKPLAFQTDPNLPCFRLGNLFLADLDEKFTDLFVREAPD